MKKFSLFLVLVFSFFVGHLLGVFPVSANCENIDFDGTNMKALSKKLGDCKPDHAVGKGTDDLTIGTTGDNTLQEKITQWTTTIAIISALGAVGVLVYAGMLMQFSGGNDDTINKAKEIIKVTLIGTALITVAGGIVYLVITMIFGIAGT